MITIKGKKISDFLIQTEKVTYPMEDNNFLRFIPLYEEYYFLIEKFQMIPITTARAVLRQILVQDKEKLGIIALGDF